MPTYKRYFKKHNFKNDLSDEIIKIAKDKGFDVINLITRELLRTELDLDEKYEEKIQHYVETLRYDYFQIMMKLEPNTSFPTNLIIEDLFKDLPKVLVKESPIIPSDKIKVSNDPESKDPCIIPFPP